jgi:ABC-type transport system involved in cytochrome bd biosynthesis fused ATPase/permease subunit
MVLDEPTEGLDDPEARALMFAVRRHQRDGIVVVISHQNQNHIGATIHLTVNEGRVLTSTTDVIA